MNERPYINLWWTQLNEIYSRRGNDPVALGELVAELGFRNKPKALRLQNEVISALNELTKATFTWPTTDALKGVGDNLSPAWPETGLLRFMGYTVGDNGINQFRRQKILNTIFEGLLPNVNSPEYMEEWGIPQTAKRLKKLANSIAAFVRNSKRSSIDMSKAISEWENDLEYLYENFYQGKFDFQWPKVDG